MAGHIDVRRSAVGTATDDAELAALRARVAELEGRDRARDDAPAAGRRGGRGRTAVAVVAVVLAALLVPVAVLGTWARLELVDTDRFVATFAPLAEEPAVQEFIADQAVQAINENVDIDGLVDNAFGGLAALDLPPAAQNALTLLKAPAAQGVHSIIQQAVDRLVASPAFADIWAQTLRQVHSRAIAIIQGQPGTAVTLSDSGTLSIDLGVVIAQVKTALKQQGLGIADMIPAIDKTIPLTTSDSMVLIRIVYEVAVGVGYWLPWLVLGLVALGIAVARNRLRTLAWTGVAFALALLLLAAGLGTGRLFFVGTVSPSIMPVATANVVFHQVTELMFSTIAALVMVSVLLAIGGWIAGRSPSATRVRGVVDGAFGHVRRFCDAHGMDTRAFGRTLDRWRTAVLIVVVAIAVLAVFVSRPVTAAAVITATVCIVVAVILIELLRRPASAEATAETGDAADATEVAATEEAAATVETTSN
jgi:hypothetical protein